MEGRIITPTPPKIGLNIEDDDVTHAPKVCEKFYYSYYEAFWKNRASIHARQFHLREGVVHSFGFNCY